VVVDRFARWPGRATSAFLASSTTGKGQRVRMARWVAPGVDTVHCGGRCSACSTVRSRRAGSDEPSRSRYRRADHRPDARRRPFRPGHWRWEGRRWPAGRPGAVAGSGRRGDL